MIRSLSKVVMQKCGLLVPVPTFVSWKMEPTIRVTKWGKSEGAGAGGDAGRSSMAGTILSSKANFGIRQVTSRHDFRKTLNVE